MIGVKLQGRMGNQMFQFAFGYIHAKNRAERIFISRGSSKYLLNYFLLDGYKFNFFKNLIHQALFRLGNFKSKTLYQIGFEEIEDILKQTPSCNDFDGYFQSELFFKGFEAEVKKLFEIKTVHRTSFEKKYKRFFQDNKTIVVHIRRTDYLDWSRGENFSSDASLSFAYVENFLGKFDLKTYKVIFISDDIQAVKKHFARDQNFSFESNPGIIDLQLLMNADIVCLSSSSFSWWGAYLNPKPHKQIFAPEYWLGSKLTGEYPKDIICKDWQRLDKEL